MEINLLSTIITTIAAIFTIIQITKEFIKPKSTTQIQQKNVSGDNIYFDNSTSISTSTTINYPSLQNYSDNGFENAFLSGAVGLLITCILLIFYSLTYEFISSIGLLILSITIYRDTKIPFENKKAKVQWALQKITYITFVIILFFIPKSVEDVIVQVQTLQIDSFKSLLDSFLYNIKFIWNLFYDSMLSALNVISRVLVTLFLIYYFIVSLVTNRNKHKVYSLKESITFILIMLLIIIGSNIEYFWNLIEPLRNTIEIWFDSTT
ncbi:hypothetical protein [Sediminibacillus sp. JSM 1682029]|uniref:hypothetical protein n=1 Tax=Sediminibacillus sp. JSM 1682029 TaxID=3229857 RepID=UPI0035231973